MRGVKNEWKRMEAVDILRINNLDMRFMRYKVKGWGTFDGME